MCANVAAFVPQVMLKTNLFFCCSRRVCGREVVTFWRARKYPKSARLFHFLRERAAAAVRLVGTSLALFFVWKIQNSHLFAQKETAAQVHTHFPAFSLSSAFCGSGFAESYG
jgi:hypothetical protein